MPRLKDFKIRIKNNKYYEIRFRKYGYNVSFSSTNFETAKQKAFAWLSAFESEIRANETFLVIRQKDEKIFFENKNVIFGSFAQKYLNNVKRKMVNAHTFDGLMNVYKNHIESKYKNFPIAKINVDILQTHLNKLSEEKPRVCETVKMLLTGIFEYAVNNNVIDKNPMRAVFIKKHQRTTGQALTLAEEHDFVKKIENSKHKDIFLKMLYSGVRPCEINDLEENLQDNTLKIKNGKLKNWQTNFYRTIPIFPKYQVVANVKCTKVNPRKLSYEFREYCPNHQLKDLRHTFTTRARECGIDNELVAIWTGHSLGNITASIYTHFSMEFQQKEATKLIY